MVLAALLTTTVFALGMMGGPYGGYGGMMGGGYGSGYGYNSPLYTTGPIAKHLQRNITRLFTPSCLEAE